MHHRFRWTGVSHRRNWISREYEPLQPYLLSAFCTAAGARCVVDVGANIGLYSVLLSPLVPRVIAYEASPAAAEEAARNFALNGLEVDLRRKAVSDRSGTVRFGVVSPFAGNSAVVAGDGPATEGTQIEVEAVTLDADLRGVEGPLCFKIDVEGHEMAVIDGAAETLAQTRAVIQVEDFEGRVAQRLAPLGYRLLTRVGPDHYFTNIDTLDALSGFEVASAAMIEANHETKTMMLRRGDFGLELSGRSYEFARRLAQRFLKGRL